MSIFTINWFNVVENLTPDYWRKTKAGLEAKIIANLRSIIKPIQELSDNLEAYQFQTMQFLDYTGQNIALENLLNDNYDNLQRRIFITENNVTNQAVIIDIYLQGESDPSPTSIYLQGEVSPTPFSFYLQGEVIQTLYNFTINIPSSISFDTNLVTRQVKNYSESAKTFNIITF
jgi:hypothetical protein